MGIGTSLGAYFETELDHHAGNETLDQNEYSDEGITHDDTPIPVMDKANRFGLYDPKTGYTDYFNYDSNPNSRGVKGYDYDYKSFFKDNPDAKMSPGEHYPDTFKKPNHPTFSSESMYNDIPYWNPKTGDLDKAEGGQWGKNAEGKDTFTPGRANLDHHSAQDLIDYFKKTEPDAVLLLPGM